MKEVLPYTYKQRGGRKKRRSKKLGFKDNRLKAKEYGALNVALKHVEQASSPGANSASSLFQGTEF